jgi:RNA polymerase sigma-70 factor, ECF subfamily
MSADLTFADLMQRLRAGDDDAARAVFTRFAHRLIGLARLHLDARLRQKVDPDDVVQSVYRSFFVRHAEGRFDLAGWDKLWGLLTTLTVRKCGRYRERFYADKRDLRKEFGPDDGGLEAASREPEPDEAAALADMVQALLAGLGGPHREVVSLRLQGYSTAEIAAHAGLDQRAVQRTLQAVGDRLRRTCERDEG